MSKQKINHSYVINFYNLSLKHSQLKVSYSQKILSKPITSSRESYMFLLKIWNKPLINLQEQVYALYLNSNNEIIGWRCINTGSSSETVFDLKFTLSCALSCMATNIIIAHNHPSGNLEPSYSDIKTTDRLKHAAAMLDISLLDHLIINRCSYYSLMDTKPF
jgi:DNA repair protein RadC